MAKISFNPSPEAAKGKVAAMDTSINAINLGLNSVKEIFEQINNPTVWSGSGASALKGKADELSAQFEPIYKTLTEIKAALDKNIEIWKQGL